MRKNILSSFSMKADAAFKFCSYTSLLCESCNVRTVREVENEDQDIELMIRSGAYRIIDTRYRVFQKDC